MLFRINSIKMQNKFNQDAEYNLWSGQVIWGQKSQGQYG
jgi:hypothetical protein